MIFDQRFYYGCQLFVIKTVEGSVTPKIQSTHCYLLQNIKQ